MAATSTTGGGPATPEPFEDFFARYYDRLVGFATTAFGPADADDVAQETMARALAAFASLDPERDAWPWLGVVARNVARDLRRRRLTVPLDAAESVALPSPDAPYEAAADAEDRRLVRLAFRALSDDHRRLLMMRQDDEATFGDLALRLGRTSGALRAQAMRARRALAQEFARLGGRAYGVAAAVALRCRRTADTPAAPAAGQLAAAFVAAGLAFGGVPAGMATATAQPAAVPPATARPLTRTVTAVRPAPRRPATRTRPAHAATAERDVTSVRATHLSPSPPGDAPSPPLPRDMHASLGTDERLGRPLPCVAVTPCGYGMG